MNNSRNFKLRRRVTLTLRYVLMTILAVIITFPLYIVFLDSLLSLKQITGTPPTLFSTHLNWGIFVRAWDEGGLARAFVNSVLMTGGIVIGQLITATLAAYAYAFLDFPLKRTFFALTIATMGIPFEVTLISNFQTITSLHLNNNLGGLIVPFLATGLGIFLIRAAFMQIPREMHEAATIDGATHLQFLRRVAIPMARPSIAAVAVFGFLGAWNSYLWPVILTANNEAIRPLQIQIKSLSGDINTANLQIAAAAITVVPLLVILFFFQKQLIRSLTAGAVK